MVIRLVIHLMTSHFNWQHFSQSVIPVHQRTDNSKTYRLHADFEFCSPPPKPQTHANSNHKSSLLEQHAKSLGSESKDGLVHVTILRMVFLPTFTLSILNFLLLFAFSTQAGLYAECDPKFANIKSVTDQSLEINATFRSLTNRSLACRLETNDTIRLMYFRAKRIISFIAAKGEARISFLSQK